MFLSAYSDNCVRRHSKKVFECSRTRREPVHSKTVLPFLNGDAHNSSFFQLNNRDPTEEEIKASLGNLYEKDEQEQVNVVIEEEKGTSFV
jgi:hypothetical protein